MKIVPAALFLASLFLDPVEASVLHVQTCPDVAWQWGRSSDSMPYDDLQAAIDAAAEGDTIRIAPGLFAAHPQPFRDPLCGNCLEHRTEVGASTGFRILGKRLTLLGSGVEKTILATRAGYGVYVEDACGSVIRDLAITGGTRDADGNATDAAVVVRGGRVTLENLHLRDNTDRLEGVVVGIGGVMGREGAELVIRNCRILNNGWDGVALYRGATALITDNVIETGRGAGIGITWDAAALVLRNRVSDYWKGIGTFGASRAIVRNNAVFDNLGWGIIATGDSHMEASHNVIFRNGNCGLAVWSETATGLAIHNIIAENGWRKEWVCPRVGIWHQSAQEAFPVRANLLFGNAGGDWLSEQGEEPAGGLLRFDPLFRSAVDFRLQIGSPAVDAGDSIRTEPDGTRCDIGLTGGPSTMPTTGAPPEPLPAERVRGGSPAWLESRR